MAKNRRIVKRGKSVRYSINYAKVFGITIPKQVRRVRKKLF